MLVSIDRWLWCGMLMMIFFMLRLLLCLMICFIVGISVLFLLRLKCLVFMYLMCRNFLKFLVLISLFRIVWWFLCVKVIFLL